MDDDGRIRLNKALADAGVASRRGADALITAGRVRSTGRPSPTLAGASIPVATVWPWTAGPCRLPPRNARHDTAAQAPGLRDHGPRSRGPAHGLRQPARALPRPAPFFRGAAGFFSEGLLLLTTDGELAFRLAHPRWHVEKRYRVTVRGKVDAGALAAMEGGMTLAEGERLAPVPTRILDRPAPDRTVLELRLSQGVNRQIRRMCRDLGLTVLTLARVAQGPLFLGDLPPGQCRELTPQELAGLRRAVGLAVDEPPARPSPATGGPAAPKSRNSASGRRRHTGKRP